MNTSWGRGFQICFTIIGTTIGAGFASGREIWEFFGSYGLRSIWSIIVAMTLFAIVNAIVLWISWKEQTKHYFEVLSLVMGNHIARLFDIVILFFLMSSAVVMLAGSGAVFEQWGLSRIIGTVVLAFAVWVVLLFNVDGILSLNVVLVPLMTLVIVTVCTVFLRTDASHMTDAIVVNADRSLWPSGVIYAAFNIVPLMAVIATFGRRIKRMMDIVIASVGSAACLGTVAILFNTSMIRKGPVISEYDIPLFALLNAHTVVTYVIVALIIWMAIYTTAVSSVYGAVHRISSHVSKSHAMIGFGLLVILLPLSQFGFATLVKVVYSSYGLINLFVLAMVILYPLARLR